MMKENEVAANSVASLESVNFQNHIRNKETPDVEVNPTTNEKEEVPSIPFFQLFKYSTGLDKILICFALIFSLVGAACMTLVALAFGDIAGVIVTYAHTAQMNGTDPVVMEEAGRVLEEGMIWFVAATSTLGAIILISTYFSTVMLNYSALRQTFKIRELFFSQVLNQDISWYDQNQTGDFSSRMADDLKTIEEGIGEKIGIIVFYEGVFIASIIQSLVKGWELTLICLTSIPVTVIIMGAVAWISSKMAKQEAEAYGEAGAVAEETLSSIRTVVAFGGQEKEEARYNHLLLAARNNNIKRSFLNGVSQGISWLLNFATYSLAFWYGVKLVLADRGKPANEVKYEAGNMIAIFSGMITGIWYFGMAAPFIEAIGGARAAAAKIFHVIASQPIINKSKGTGKKPRKIAGKITFNDVHFTYPSRKDSKVLKGLNLTINSGETVALVGSSGCGKSTCIQLLQRFYDPDSGSIHIDNYKMTDWDLNWLRNYVGVVGQEPVLFETTIAENIRYGNLDASQEEIEKAAKKANAHAFITALPNGYSTMIGERGAQLSGGQKQRIAIARALVREPAILLLDEATSALDTKSEAVVQVALDAASHGCTTVIVAHRLSTIRQADRIIVISDGQVKEEGSHDALMLAKGAYHKLVTTQVTEQEGIDYDVTQAIDEVSRNELLVQESSYDSDVKGPSPSPITLSEFVKVPESSASTSSLWAIMKYNSSEWWAITLGCLSSIITGSTLPAFSVLFGDIVGILGDVDDEVVRSEGNKFSMCFLIIGAVSGVALLIQCYTFGFAGEKLTMRLRSLTYKAMLQQEIGWFDVKDNGVGALCTRLSGEAASVQGATGQRIGTMLNSATTIITALTIAFYYEWRLTLVCLCFAPVIVIFVYLEQKIIAKESESHYETLQNSTKTAVEAINGIRTVASLGCEQIFHDLYMNKLIPYHNEAKRNTHVRGIVYAVSRSLFCFGYVAILYYGAQLIKNEGLPYASVFIVNENLITSSMSLANALAFTPNFSKGLIAAHRIFDLINRTPTIVDGSENVSEKWETGNINYKNIFFSYPNRPKANVLKGLNLSVLHGKTVALVGPSGCGKSTIVQLLERFYDPNSGEITADERGIQKMNLLALRSHLGIVSQEPNLFSKTIAENIAYGDNTRTVTKDEVISAAKQANIHTFITSLPLGYETKLGEKGTQLSGGQKQRVAIARALVRNPKVLILDEATSALDAESEKVVQEALDNAKVGRTGIFIAHRLTTIQDADLICVINHGSVCEVGTHSELLNQRGLYYNLYRLQSYQQE